MSKVVYEAPRGLLYTYNVNIIFTVKAMRREHGDHGLMTL